MRIPRAIAVNAHAVLLVCLSMLVGPGISLDATAQPTWHNLESGEHAVGFRLLQERDNTRVVTGTTDQARPVRVYLWYPAASPDAPPMRFGRYAALAEDDVWPIEIVGSPRERLSYSHHVLARSLGPDGFEALGEQPVRAFENAEPLPGPFPLIVIGQGLNYESPIAFAALSEYLAGRGFVVATCPLVGTHTPFLKLDVEDLETQVRDLEFVIARARAFPHVSPDKLGVMGFDRILSQYASEFFKAFLMNIPESLAFLSRGLRRPRPTLALPSSIESEILGSFRLYEASRLRVPD